MPQVPQTCPASGQPTSKYYLHTSDGHFVDTSGRTVLLRGVNLSGSSKAPVNQPSYVLDGFWESAQAGGKSFVGRPLNLDDGSADVHLSRLRGWGFNVLRYPIAWESLEHEGPGLYDHEFMDYTIRVLRKCKEYGFKVYLDPHQDSWSRFSGGSGAPYWTLPACGINPQAFTATQAAIIHCEYTGPDGTPDPSALPSMVWSTNYSRLASQTLFALFFGSRTFAPKCVIDGVHIQDYLQSHFIEAFGTLADRIRDAGGLLDDVVIGWDSMNEPAEGFIGYEDLSVYPTKQGSALKKGTMPTPLQSFKLGVGTAQTLDNYSFGLFGSSRAGSITVDPNGVSIWADPSTEPNGVHPKWGWKRSSEWTLGKCIWALHGVWDPETGTLLKPKYFNSYPSSEAVPINYLQDFLLPHLTDYVTRIRAAHPGAIAFIQAPVFSLPPETPEMLLKGRACHSTHFYDGLTLVTCQWHMINADAVGLIRGKYSSSIFAARFGEWAIRSCMQSQLGMLKADGVLLGADIGGLRRYPTIIGEIGVPIDLDDKKAYDPKQKSYRDYSTQERALDASLNGADGVNVLNYTVWTYCPDNSHMWGDNWCNEDLSLWSKDDVQGQDKGGKAGAKRGGAVESRAQAEGSLVSAAVSSTSLATLPVMSMSSPYAKPASSSRSPHELLWFLRNGARAVRAFCRPYPVSVVGAAVNVQFDIGKARLKVKIRVSPADAPPPEAFVDVEGDMEVRAETQGDGGMEDGVRSISEKGEQVLPTEIFVPLVHFASDECVERSVVVAREVQREGDAEEAEDAHNAEDTRSLQGGEPGSQSRTGSSMTLTSMMAFGKGETIRTDGYAMQVTVSEGQVEVDEGEQILRWYYAVPASGEREKEVTIEVARVGGAINWSKVSASRRQSQVKRLCGGQCPEGCTIM